MTRCMLSATVRGACGDRDDAVRCAAARTDERRQGPKYHDQAAAAGRAGAATAPTAIPISPVTGSRTAPARASRGRFGVDPAAIRHVRSEGHARGAAAFQPWALAKIKAMTPTELELSKSSVNCLPRGVPAIWLQNPYTTLIVHKPGLMAQLYEVLNNWRVIHLDGRPLPKDPEPFFHGNSAARWEGDTLVVDSIGFDDRTYIQPNGWFHSDALHVTERYTPPVDELPDRRDHGGRSEGAREAVEVGAAPLDAGRRRDLRVLLHQQQGTRAAREAARSRSCNKAGSTAGSRAVDHGI